MLEYDIERAEQRGSDEVSREAPPPRNGVTFTPSRPPRPPRNGQIAIVHRDTHNIIPSRFPRNGEIVASERPR